MSPARTLKIGVDLMGNDNSPMSVLHALKELPLPEHIQIVAIGSSPLEKEARPLLFIPASDAIEMEENPLLALRRKKQASVSVGLRLLKEKKIDAFISAGNTGALVVAAKMILGTIQGILRPALLTLMPTKKNPVAVLDVGGNVQVINAYCDAFFL